MFSIIESLLIQDRKISAFGYSILAKFQSDMNSHLRGSTKGVAEIYPDLMRDLDDCCSSKTNHEANMCAISEIMVSLETRPEKWRELQFLHINRFPRVVCRNCKSSVCFSCGQAPFHDGQTCTECLQVAIHHCEAPETLANLNWRLMNGKRCPNCSVTISRDDGCNKVDCLFCGHKFCWHCLGKFDNGGCGYYRCQLKGSEASPQSRRPDDTPEIGVPNIVDVQSKWKTATVA